MNDEEMNIAQGRIEVKLVGDRQPPLTGLFSVPAEDGYVIAVERVDGVMPNGRDASAEDAPASQITLMNWQCATDT